MIGFLLIVVVIRSVPISTASLGFLISFLFIYIESHLRILRSPRAQRIYGFIGWPLIILAVVIGSVGSLITGAVLLWQGETAWALFFLSPFIAAALLLALVVAQSSPREPATHTSQSPK